MSEQTPLLNIIWIRHGYSCANRKRDENKSKNFFKRILEDKHYNIPDPQLHEIGIEQAKDLAENFNKKFLGKIDLICSSELLRSIETAQVFSTHLDDSKKSSNLSDKVLILPFINEKTTSSTEDNIPTKIFKKCSGSIIAPPIAYCKNDPNLLFLDIPTKYYEDSQFFTDYKKFRKILLPELQKSLVFFYGKKEHYNIVIVCHSHYLKNNLGLKHKPSNTQVVVEYDALGEDIILQDPEKISENHAPNTPVFKYLNDWDAYTKGYNFVKDNKRCLPEKTYQFQSYKKL
jgi:hypothetical protein